MDSIFSNSASGAETTIFQTKLTNTMVADALAPSVTRPWAAMVLAVWNT